MVFSSSKVPRSRVTSGDAPRQFCMPASRYAQRNNMAVPRNHLVLQTNHRGIIHLSCRVANNRAKVSPQRRISLIKLRKVTATKVLLRTFGG